MFALLVTACEGSHTDLGVEPTTSVTVTVGATTSTGMGMGGEGGTSTIVEPDGPPKLTLVHGVVDQPELLFCFLESPPNASDAAAPFPAQPLPYARSVALALPGSPVPAAGDVEVAVIGGDLTGVGGLGCRELYDDPTTAPGALVVSLGVVPRAVLDAQRSLLVVPTGCLGGPGHDHESATAVCGIGYTPDTPTPNVVFAPMSRYLDGTAIGLQVVHALSGTTQSVDVGLVPFGGSERKVGKDVTFGEISPFPPSTLLSASDLEGLTGVAVRTYLLPSGGLAEESVLADAAANGGLSPEDFKNGTNVVLLVVGPTPGVPAGPWWSGVQYVALRADP